MSDRLPVPPGLEHLIEKRDTEDDRRHAEQRTGGDQRQVDLGPAGAIVDAENIDDLPVEDRRSENERRDAERRKKLRRNEG